MRGFLRGGYREWVTFAAAMQANLLPAVEEMTRAMTEFALAMHSSEIVTRTLSQEGQN